MSPQSFPGHGCPVAVARWYLAEYGASAGWQLREAAQEACRWREAARAGELQGMGPVADLAEWDRRLGVLTHARRLLRVFRPIVGSGG